MKDRKGQPNFDNHFAHARPHSVVKDAEAALSPQTLDAVCTRPVLATVQSLHMRFHSVKWLCD